MTDSLTFLIIIVFCLFPFASIGFCSHLLLGLARHTFFLQTHEKYSQISCILHWTVSPSAAETSQSCSTCKGHGKNQVLMFYKGLLSK